MAQQGNGKLETSTADEAEATAAATGDETAEEWVLEDVPSDPPVAASAEAERLKKELAEVREQWVRTLADLDNYRKRSEREAREVKRYALFEPMRDLIGVVDNLERALSAGGAVEDLKRGVELILVQLRDVLRTHGVRDVEALGAAFDPGVHDAVARFESAEAEAPTVAEELQRGYMMFDRLLRPALVKVAIPASGGAEGGDDAAARHGAVGDAEA